MNIRFSSCVLSLALCSGGVFADDAGRTDYAKVVKVKPIYEEVVIRTPRESCWNERVVRRDRFRDSGVRSHTPVVLGAILGGVLGNELGHHKKSQKVGAVLGGLLGASIGRDIGHRRFYRHRGHHWDRNNHYSVQERRCEVSYDVEHEEKLVGYRVTYRYGGETYRTRLDHDPGDRLKVRVSVEPVY